MAAIWWRGFHYLTHQPSAGGDTGLALLLWRRWRQSQVAKNLNPKLHSAIVIPRVHQNTPQSKSYCWKWRKDIENRANFLHRSPSKQCWSLTQLWTVGETCWWLVTGASKRRLSEGKDFIITPTSAFTFKTLMVSIVSYSCCPLPLMIIALAFQFHVYFI